MESSTLSTGEQLWKCDCGKIGTEKELEGHIFEEGTLPNGEFKPIEDIKHWGMTRVDA